jgi:tetratricopeptide (TPR) repeat protein
MIKHYAFFEALGHIEEKTPEWQSVFAGLSLMRLIDRVADSADAVVPGPADFDASLASAEAVSAGNPGRAILIRIIQQLERSQELSVALGADLISYGRSLDLDARWPLAADVFHTVSDIFSERTHPRIVIESSTLLGAAARSSGDWEASTRAYARAEHLAERTGDRARALTARVGLANSQIMRGDLPGAERELDQVVVEATTEHLESVLQIALHARASVAHYRGEYQQTIHLAYRSMELTTNSTARERLLGDIAAAYAELGMRDTARSAYSIIAMTSPHQWLRWQSILNMIELAVQEGDEAGFDNLLQQLEGAALDPKLRTYSLYFHALGSRRFGRPDALELFDKAQGYAESHKLNQLAFEIEAARNTVPVVPASVDPSSDLLQIAEMIEHLRDQAEAGSR